MTAVLVREGCRCADTPWPLFRCADPTDAEADRWRHAVDIGMAACAICEADLVTDLIDALLDGWLPAVQSSPRVTFPLSPAARAEIAEAIAWTMESDPLTVADRVAFTRLEHAAVELVHAVLNTPQDDQTAQIWRGAVDAAAEVIDILVDLGRPPGGFDPERAVEEDRDAHVARARTTRAGGHITRRWVLPFGWTAFLHRFWGPPTWWVPKITIKAHRRGVEVGIGWLRVAATFALRRGGQS